MHGLWAGRVPLGFVEEDSQAAVGTELQSSPVPVEVGLRSSVLKFHATDGVGGSRRSLTGCANFEQLDRFAQSLERVLPDGSDFEGEGGDFGGPRPGVPELVAGGG